MANFCIGCGAKQNGDEKFCKFCGTALVPNAPVPNPEIKTEEPETETVSAETVDAVEEVVQNSESVDTVAEEPFEPIAEEAQPVETSDTQQDQPEVHTDNAHEIIQEKEVKAVPTKPARKKKKAVAIIAVIVALLLIASVAVLAVYLKFNPASKAFALMEKGEWDKAIEIYDDKIDGSSIWEDRFEDLTDDYDETVLELYEDGKLGFEETVNALDAIEKMDIADTQDIIDEITDKKHLADAESFAESGDFKQAIELLNNIDYESDLYYTADEKLDTYYSDYNEAVFNNADLALESGEWEQALTSLADAKAFLSQFTSYYDYDYSNREYYANSHIEDAAYSQAWELFEKGEYSDALEIVNRALALVGDNYRLSDLKESIEYQIRPLNEIYTVPFSNDELDKHISLARDAYFGLAYSKVEFSPTEDEVNARIDEILLDYSSFESVADRGAQEGDLIIVDYDSDLGDDFFGYEHVMGTDSDIDVIFVGMKTGESSVFEMISETDLDGNGLLDDIENVTLTVISLYEIIRPELTDDFVKTMSTCQTADEYRTLIRDELQQEYDYLAKAENRNNVLEIIYNSTNVMGYPEEEYQDYYSRLYMNLQSDANDYGLTIEQYAEQVLGMSPEAVESYLDEQTRYLVGMGMMCAYIMEKEGLWSQLTITDYNEYLKFLAENGEMSAYDYESLYGELLIMNLMAEKVCDFVVSNAQPVTAQPDDAPATAIDGADISYTDATDITIAETEMAE